MYTHNHTLHTYMHACIHTYIHTYIITGIISLMFTVGSAAVGAPRQRHVGDAVRAVQHEAARA